MVAGMPPVPFPERCYRWFWWRKADVFRLFMSLQNVIDGCTWPQHDAKRVHELLGLIHHVTGVPPRSQWQTVNLRVLYFEPCAYGAPRQTPGCVLCGRLSRCFKG